VDDDAAQRAHCACVALECVLAQCHTAAQLADADAGTSSQAASAVIAATWQLLLPALALSLGRARGEALCVQVLKAHTAFTCAAAGVHDVDARDAFLQTLCRIAQDTGEGPPVADGIEDGTACARPAAAPLVPSAAAELMPHALHCVRALLNTVLALAPGLGLTGWRPVLGALARVDAALESHRTGAEPMGTRPVGEHATMATALEQLYSHAATTLPDDALQHLITVAREVSGREMRDAAAVLAVPSAASGGRRNADSPRLYMLMRHAQLVTAAPHRLAALWPELEAHAAVGLLSDAAAVRCEAASILGNALQCALAADEQHLSSPAAVAAARAMGESTFTCLLLRTLERSAVAKPETGDVREALLRTLLDIIERRSEMLGAAWLPALQFMASSAKDAQLYSVVARPTTEAADDAAAHGPLASGFACATTLVQHLLPSVPASLRVDVVATLASFGHQQVDVNTALSAVGLIWDVADYAARGDDDESGNASAHAVAEQQRQQPGSAVHVLPVVFSTLASLSRDTRPEIRNSAVRALVAAQAAHAPRLPAAAAQAALWDQLLPAVRAVRGAASGGAATDDAGAVAASTPGKQRGVVLLLHHSRNTAAKQWDETLVLCLGGLTRVLRGQLAAAAAAPGFEVRWAGVLDLLADAAVSPSREVGSAALACLAALAGFGVPVGAPWSRLLSVFEQAARDSRCDAVRGELPGALLRLYAAHKAAFQPEDVALLLRVADAVVRTPPATNRQPYAGELPAHQTAALELLTALLPLQPHTASAGVHQAMFHALAAQVSDAALACAPSSDETPAAAGPLTAAYATHVVGLLASMFAAAPVRVRADVLAATAAAITAAGDTQQHAPAGTCWRAALCALPPLFREGPLALHACAAQLDAAAVGGAWRALLRAAECLLRLDAGNSCRGLLAGDAPGAPVQEDAAQLAADEEAHAAALDALADGALGGIGAVGAPTDVLAGLVTLLDAAAVAAPGGSATQAACTHRLANVCTRKLYALSSAPLADSARGHAGADGKDARLTVACLALPTLLVHCQALLSQCAAADADAAGAGAPRAARDAALCALEAVGELRPDARAVDAAAARAVQAGRVEPAVTLALLPALRAARPAARHERAHLLLLYGPLVEALGVRDARLRAAVAGACGRSCALLYRPLRTGLTLAVPRTTPRRAAGASRPRAGTAAGGLTLVDAQPTPVRVARCAASQSAIIRNTTPRFKAAGVVQRLPRG
jgi:hypothetical protein